jgi:hypothetical protein
VREFKAPTFSDIGSQIAARLSALRTGWFLPPGRFLVLLLEAESTGGPQLATLPHAPSYCMCIYIYKHTYKHILNYLLTELSPS